MKQQPRLTVVIPTYHRADNLKRIVPSITKHGFVRQVIVWNNGHEKVGWAQKSDRVLFVDSNVCVWGRYLAALRHTDNDWIGTQDDDYILTNWPEIYETAIANPTQIVSAMHAAPNQQSGIQPVGLGWEAMLGWGAVFHRSWIMPTFNPYLRQYGEDDVLHNEADRLFTILRGERHVEVKAHANPLPGAGGPTAMHKQDGQRRRIGIARCRAIELLKRAKNL